jgi:hypothetical protein
MQYIATVPKKLLAPSPTLQSSDSPIKNCFQLFFTVSMLLLYRRRFCRQVLFYVNLLRGLSSAFAAALRDIIKWRRTTQDGPSDLRDKRTHMPQKTDTFDFAHAARIIPHSEKNT